MLPLVPFEGQGTFVVQVQIPKRTLGFDHRREERSALVLKLFTTADL